MTATIAGSDCCTNELGGCALCDQYGVQVGEGDKNVLVFFLPLVICCVGKYSTSNPGVGEAICSTNTYRFAGFELAVNYYSL